jgi:RNA 3'-terminal phosphate cyclase (ATP)
VVDGVVAEARAWEAHDVPIGEHLADQLILPVWLAGGGRLRTVPPSRHTRTQLNTLRRFTDARVDTSEHPDGVRIEVA